MKWFELGLVILTFASGLVWLLDRLFFAKARRARVHIPVTAAPTSPWWRAMSPRWKAASPSPYHDSASSESRCTSAV